MYLTGQFQTRNKQRHFILNNYLEAIQWGFEQADGDRRAPHSNNQRESCSVAACPCFVRAGPGRSSRSCPRRLCSILQFASSHVIRIQTCMKACWNIQSNQVKLYRSRSSKKALTRLAYLSYRKQQSEKKILGWRGTKTLLKRKIISWTAIEYQQGFEIWHPANERRSTSSNIPALKIILRGFQHFHFYHTIAPMCPLMLSAMLRFSGAWSGKSAICQRALDDKMHNLEKA